MGDESPHTCPTCGRQLSPGSETCPNCGQASGASGRRDHPQERNQQAQSPGQTRQSGPNRPQRNSGDSDSNTGLIALVLVGGVGLLLLVALVATPILASWLLSFEDPPERDAQPTASFEYEYDAETNELVVTYTEGDRLQGEDIELEGDVAVDGSTWADKAGEGKLQPGDSITLTPTDDPFTVRLTWPANDADHHVVLDEYEQRRTDSSS